MSLRLTETPASQPLEIHTTRLVLRAYCSEDIDIICDFVNNPQRLQNLPRAYNIIQKKEDLLATIQQSSPQQFFGFTIRTHTTTDLLGIVTSTFYPNSTVLLGWDIAPSYRDNGYATEAGMAIRDWLFQTSEITGIVGHTFSANHPSRRVMEKLGMSIQKLNLRNRIHLQFAYQEWRIIISYALHRLTWETLPDKIDYGSSDQNYQ